MGTCKRGATLILLSHVWVAGHVFADNHSDAECREGGEFIRNAAYSRDAGMKRDDFLDRMDNDLAAIRFYPVALRWFARDESDEQLLMEHAKRVFDRPSSPQQHEQEFLNACKPLP